MSLNSSQKDQGQFSISSLDEVSSGGSSSRTWFNEVNKRLLDAPEVAEKRFLHKMNKLQKTPDEEC
jgi:hypothetical protein